MEIHVGAFDPDEERCFVWVKMHETVNGRGQSVDVGVWVNNVDSRSALYADAKAQALPQLERAVAALKEDLSGKK
ncbi:hypothetical protein [Azotobacter salinestris]|uniref:hypothetical protein n=1 Tax=Azotobacter salinestris TaxID=69964 RepID=UPI0032DF9FC8